MELLWDELKTEIGALLLVLVADQSALCALYYESERPQLMQRLTRRYGQFQMRRAKNPQGFTELLQAYFAGDYQALDRIPVSAEGTPFQQQVWSALRAIPSGETIAYGELAAKIGKPTAARAVGLANAVNPVAIVVPCHRVIGANAKLVGYGGGLERKQWLLNHEGVTLPVVG
ncbi:methylated-DNA--[protein]-cysteine S-methyltransferase [Pseudanabaena sp. FACHB-2040]|nr:methylated-DNA--[protein]-cysteine S-methyltransferase [Pseudanabaena sp. FACHB-2040]